MATGPTGRLNDQQYADLTKLVTSLIKADVTLEAIHAAVDEAAQSSGDSAGVGGPAADVPPAPDVTAMAKLHGVTPQQLAVLREQLGRTLRASDVKSFAQMRTNVRGQTFR